MARLLFVGTNILLDFYRANDTPYGLAGSVWTRTMARSIRIAKAIRAATCE